MLNRKTPFIAALALLGALSTAGAHAANVQWSIGVNLPPVTTVVSSGPVYGQPVYAEPVYVQPAYAPAPVYVQPAPVVVYRPRPVYRPYPVIYRPYPVYHGYPVGRPVPVVMPGRGGYYDHRDHHDHDGYRDDHRDDHRGGHDGHRR